MPTRRVSEEYRARNPRPRRSDYASDEEYSAAVERWTTAGEYEGSNDESRRRTEARDADAYARAQADEQAAWDAMSYEERARRRSTGYRPPSEGGGSGGGGGAVSEFDRVSADIPIWGDLTGSRARLARSEADAARDARLGYINDLAEFMPSEDELSVEYGNEDMIGPGEDSLRARDAFREWSEGGFTDADRAMMDEARRRSGMTARADREASLSALEARGMGGSGSSLAASLAAGEGAADRGASMDATMMGAAQDRQYRATTALGEFGAREDEYGRGREGRNTDRENRTRESAAEAAQRAHENRSDITSFYTGGDPNARDPNAEEDEADETAGGILSGLGDWISSW